MACLRHGRLPTGELVGIAFTTEARAIPDRDSLLLQTPESLARALALDVRTGQDVIRIDRDAKEVEVHDLAQGRTYRESYDKLVLCLGAEPVRPGPPP